MKQYPVERIKRKVFNSLPEYSLSNPSGTFVGKVWKRNLFFGIGGEKWIICEYVESGTSEYINIDYRIPEIIEDE